jgi:hypothetical protein
MLTFDVHPIRPLTWEAFQETLKMRNVLILMFFGVLALPLAVQAMPQDAAEELPLLLLDVRAREALEFGTGTESGQTYFDVPIAYDASQGVLIKLGYTQRGGELSFDLHHRASLSAEFELPAEIMTVVEVITGASNRMGTFTLLNTLGPDVAPVEPVDRASEAEVDRYVSPLGRKRVTIATEPGPQSISIVGRELTIRREGFVTRIDTPGTRIAMISNIRFEEVRPGETLTFDDGEAGASNE